MTSDTYHVYSAHPYLHPAVGIPDALVLLVDEASCSLYDLPGTVTACLNAGLHMFGELLREGVVSRLRLRRRHKKALRRTLQRWLQKRGGKIMRQPTKAESKTLLRLAADTAACSAVLHEERSLLQAMTWDNAASSDTKILDLRGACSNLHPLAPALMSTALTHGNHIMVRLLRDHVALDGIVQAHLTSITNSAAPEQPFLDAVIETMREPAALLRHAVLHGSTSAVAERQGARRGRPVVVKAPAPSCFSDGACDAVRTCAPTRPRLLFLSNPCSAGRLLPARAHAVHVWSVPGAAAAWRARAPLAPQRGHRPRPRPPHRPASSWRQTAAARHAAARLRLRQGGAGRAPRRHSAEVAARGGAAARRAGRPHHRGPARRAVERLAAGGGRRRRLADAGGLLDRLVALWTRGTHHVGVRVGTAGSAQRGGAAARASARGDAIPNPNLTPTSSASPKYGRCCG